MAIREKDGKRVNLVETKVSLVSTASRNGNENILAQFRTQLQQSILDLLTKQGPLPRREIVKQLQRARTTIYDNLIKLQKQNIVEKFVRNSGTRGRSLVFWKLII